MSLIFSLTQKLSVTQPIEEDIGFAEWASGVIPEIPDRETVEKHVQNMVDAVFKTYDLDKNGSISKEEFDALATNFPFIDNFAVLDVNWLVFVCYCFVFLLNLTPCLALSSFKCSDSVTKV